MFGRQDLIEWKDNNRFSVLIKVIVCYFIRYYLIIDIYAYKYEQLRQKKSPEKFGGFYFQRQYRAI